MTENVENLLFQTAQLFIVLGAIVIVARLVMKYLTRQGAGTDKKSNIHVYYLVGIGSLLLIELVTYILTREEPASSAIFDQISFASTISSILLSVIAIIYSIVSGSNGANLYVKTEEVSKQIGETLSDLRDLSTTVEKLEKIPDDIEKHLQELKEQMQRMEEISQQTSQQLNQEVTPKIDKILSEKVGGLVNGGDSSGARDLKSPSKEREAIFRDYISRSSFYAKLVLLGCCYAKEKDKVVELKGIFGLSEDPFLQGYLGGYALASGALGILDVQLEGTKLNVKDIKLNVKDIYQSESFDLKELVMSHLTRIRKSREFSEELKSSLEKNLKEMKEYFGVEE